MHCKCVADLTFTDMRPSHPRGVICPLILMAPNLLSVCVVMTCCPTIKVPNGHYNGMAWHHHDQKKYIILRGDAVLLKRGRNEREMIISR